MNCLLRVVMLMTIVCLSAAGNNIQNPGFERGSATVSNWFAHTTPIPADGTPVTGTKLKEWRHTSVSAVREPDGNRALLIETDGSTDVYGLAVQRGIPILSGYSYCLKLRYRAEGLQYPKSFFTVDFFTDIQVEKIKNFKGKRCLGNNRILGKFPTDNWTALETSDGKFRIPDSPYPLTGQIRITPRNSVAGNRVKIRIDNVEFLCVDEPLRNPGFENGSTAPHHWQRPAAGRGEWVMSPVKSGKRAVSVSDVPQGGFDGWTMTAPVRPDREYAFSGMVKGGKLNPHGFVGGGALRLLFIDRDGNVVGTPRTSPAVPANTDWTETTTGFATPPSGAVAARLTAGLEYCDGTEYFDDLRLDARKIATRAENQPLKRVAAVDPSVRYSENLIANGTVEKGTGATPDGWTFHGKSQEDWTPEELKRFAESVFVDFNVGRGIGVWESADVFSGGRALRITPIVPRVKAANHWREVRPVDGYWISDPVPCTPGEKYLAGGWWKKANPSTSLYEGPLSIRFYDRDDREISIPAVRSGMSDPPSGEWGFWATRPFSAPAGAVRMRLRFGTELHASPSGWQGTMLADNLAVWKMPATPVEPAGLDTEGYRRWFMDTHRAVKPPYLPMAEESDCARLTWGYLPNSTPGNLFDNPSAPVPLNPEIFNLPGERRKVRLSMKVTDAYGKDAGTFLSPEVELNGWSRRQIPMQFPAPRKYGTWHIEFTVLESGMPTGVFSGRFGVLPPARPDRATANNRLAVTTLWMLPHTPELAAVLKRAGFSLGWVGQYSSLELSVTDPKAEAAAAAEIDFFRSIGIRTILRLKPAYSQKKHPRKIDFNRYKQYGVRMAELFGDRVAAFGNWGVEQANTRSPYRGAPSFRVTDFEYDSMMANIYDGIRSVRRDIPVVTGNIATDFEANTIRRLYQSPGQGKFDGAILNSYMGIMTTVGNALKEFDRHGDVKKGIYLEEHAVQRAPFSGPERRYGELQGAGSLIRLYAGLLGGPYGKRMHAVTMWGFAPTRGMEDIAMMTRALQPRPVYAAQAVFADFTSGWEWSGDCSKGDYSCYELRRAGKNRLIAFAEAGKSVLPLETEARTVTVADLFGNRRTLTPRNGSLSVEINGLPCYLEADSPLRVGSPIELELSNGTVEIERPELSVKVRNASREAVEGELSAGGESVLVKIPAESSRNFGIRLRKAPEANRRKSFTATLKTGDNRVFPGFAALNFLMAPRAQTPPALDGSWTGWERAPWVDLNERTRSPYVQEPDSGDGDVSGKVRLLWDERNLYLGVAVEDDVFLPKKGIGLQGFMGDSIEFAIQPDGIFRSDAPKFECEMYLPQGEKQFVLSSRFPRAAIVNGWRGIVKPTGRRGGAVYQLAIPWNGLGTSPVPGKRLGFALNLNDKDNSNIPYTGERNIRRLFDGVGSKDPAKYGQLRLVK